MTDFFSKKPKQSEKSIDNYEEQCCGNGSEVDDEEPNVISVNSDICKDNRVVTILSMMF